MFIKKMISRLPFIILNITIFLSPLWLKSLLLISDAPFLIVHFGYIFVLYWVICSYLMYMFSPPKKAFIYQCVSLVFCFAVLLFVSNFQCALILCTYALLIVCCNFFMDYFMRDRNVLLAITNNDMFTLKLQRYIKPFFASIQYKSPLNLLPIYPLIFALNHNASDDLIRYLIRLSPGAALELAFYRFERRLLELITEDKCLLNLVIKKSKDFFPIKRHVLHSVMNARLDVIKVIIENANVEDNAFKKVLLFVSASRGDSDIFLYLFGKFSSSLSDSDYDTLYEDAAKVGNPEIVDTIRSNGKDYDFNKLLSISSQEGSRRDLCEYMIGESGVIDLSQRVDSLVEVHDEVSFLFYDLGLISNRPTHNYNRSEFENKTINDLLNLFSNCRNDMICYLSYILGSGDLSKLEGIISARYLKYMPVMQRNLLYMFEYFNKDVIDKIKNKFQEYVNEKKYDEAYCYLIRQAAINIKACGSASFVKSYPNFRNYLEPIECTGLPSDLNTIVLEYNGKVLERC